jgi:hypothetical protein
MADALLRSSGSDLKSFLSDARSRNISYEDTAKELYLKTEGAVSVTYQTIKRWLVEFELLEVAS